MKIKTKGFSVIEFIMIVVVLAIVGVFVYFASKSKQVDLMDNSSKSATDTVAPVPNTPDTGASVPVEMGKIVDYVKQIATDAESRFNGTYKTSFTASNSAQANGSGLVLSSNSLSKQTVEDVAKIGGKIFAITNDKVTAYALYISLPNQEGKYYCMASDGSKNTSTMTVVTSKDLTSKPICK